MFYLTQKFVVIHAGKSFLVNTSQNYIRNGNFNQMKGVIFLYKKYEELLIKTGKTSYQVSKDTGIGQNTLSNWKTGRSNPKIDKLKILADYFGVEVGFFLE